MQGSYFHHLFLLCIWLSVKAPQLGCDAVSISGQEDRAAANQCWQKCSLAANVSRSTAKAFEVSYSFTREAQELIFFMLLWHAAAYCLPLIFYLKCHA